MACNAEHPVICLWTFCMSFLEKCLFRSFAHFLIGLFVFLVWSHVSSLHILEIKPLSKASFENIFSHSLPRLPCERTRQCLCLTFLNFPPSPFLFLNLFLFPPSSLSPFPLGDASPRQGQSQFHPPASPWPPRPYG